MSTPPFPEWCEAAPDAEFSQPTDCAARASSFERRIRFRNLLEYTVGAILILVTCASSALAFVKGETLVGAALALICVGVGAVLWGLYSRASNLVRRPEDACLVHLRRQYEHQQKALRAVPLWYIGPLIPGVVLLYLGVAAGAAETLGWRAALEDLAGSAAITFGIFAAVALANLWAARSLKREIKNLDALAR